MNYKHTHVSYFDGSPAMATGYDDRGGISLVNEDGHEWTDPKDDWIPVAEVTEDDRERWDEEADRHDEYTSGADYMASYYNSDSYINYLNGY